MTRFSKGPLAGIEKNIDEARWICSSHGKADACAGVIQHCALIATVYSEKKGCWIYLWSRYDVFVRTSTYGPGLAEGSFIGNYSTLHTHDARSGSCHCGKEPGF